MHWEIDVFRYISNAAEEIILYKKHLLQYLLIHKTILDIFKVNSSLFS